MDILQRFIGVGMNQEELDANPLLTERHVINLNKKPRALEELLPEESVDLINIDLSIDYMTSPGLVTNMIFREPTELLKRQAGRSQATTS